MPPKSKSKSSNRGKSKFVSKPKQEWRVKNPARNWLDLPSDLMMNILQRIGAEDILENAQKVCTAWREICKDPALWKVVYIDNVFHDPYDKVQLQQMCKHAVDRSQGQLLDLTLVDVCDNKLLQYVADRSSQLRRLELVHYFVRTREIWSEALKKLSLLEELSLVGTNISQEHIEVVGRYCPLLKILKMNQKVGCAQNEIGFAIGKNFPKLTHLQLIGSSMDNTQLQAILDGCCHLESLDLRHCLYLVLNGELGKRCSQEIKHLKLPHDSLLGYPYADDLLDPYEDYDYNDYFDYDYSAFVEDDLFDYNDYSAFIDDGSFNVELMMEKMAFRDMFG